LILMLTTLKLSRDASRRHILTYSDASGVFLTLFNVYAQMLVTHETSKMCTYASQAIATSPSTHTLKSRQFPLICNYPIWLYACELPTLSVLLTFPLFQCIKAWRSWSVPHATLSSMSCAIWYTLHLS
jgi:hypothetical protein